MVGRLTADSAPRFHSSAMRVRPSTPRNFTVCSSLCPVLTDVLSANPRAHVSPAENRSFTDGDQTALHSSLQSPIVQPDSPTADDRQGIIDAAYDCLSEPHGGPIPVAAILDRAGLSTRAFYRHFESKDELFLAMLRQEADALTDRLDGIADQVPGDPRAQLAAWVETMFALAREPHLRMHLTVIDSDEVRTAKGYRDTRERLHADRERSLERILARGRHDGSFPLTDPQSDAVAISAVVARELTISGPGSQEVLVQSQARVIDFALRAVGAERSSR
jgi:AcrR family transcriptional regulator